MLNRQALWTRLVEKHQSRNPRSLIHSQEASQFQIRGGSHNLRLFEPFPFFDEECSGSKVVDLDGNVYVDFWQGHYTNILGHNPPEVVEPLIRELQRGRGLQTGFPGSLQLELAKKISLRTGAERIRFTTSGSLATLYSVMLSRAFTKRSLVLKVGGGWHGSQPYLLKGVTAYTDGLGLVESSGLHSSISEEILTTQFNNTAQLEEVFEEFGEQIACFIMEPFIGEGGFLFAAEDYLKRARELTHDWGALLVLDEIIAGFRFCPSSLASLYGIQPDLSTFGKVLGGGMPLTAVAGRADVLELANTSLGHPKQVKFEGGTYAGHPASVLAAITLLDYLSAHADEIYPKIHQLAERARNQIPGIFERAGIRSVVTGGPSGPVSQSSMAVIHFPTQDDTPVSSPEVVWNPETCDVEMREKILRLALANEGFHVVHGFGSISTRHTEEEVDSFLSAVEAAATEIAG